MMSLVLGSNSTGSSNKILSPSKCASIESLIYYLHVQFTPAAPKLKSVPAGFQGVRVLVLSVFTTFVFCISTAAQTPCPFDSPDVDQLARCFLRPVKIYGSLGPEPVALPAPLNKLIGKRVKVKAKSLKRYLDAHGVSEDSIGGALATPLTTTRYFVIHDTSSPYLKDVPFPENINEADYRGNNLARWAQVKVTHVYVNRLGESATASNFEQTVWATKFERRNPAHRGLFVHVELIQPRRRDPSGGPTNDAFAPEPGFTDKQLERLALLYVTASVRRGRWLLPAFHAAVDAGIPDAHDDPQNFELAVWLGSVQRLLAELR
jgi:hypothetical protein